MSELARFTLEDGGWAIVEVGDSAAVVRAGARGADGIFSATVTFDSVMAQLRHVADAALRGLRESATQPDEIAIDFGIALSAQAGAVMVKSNLGAHLQVRLSWKRTPD